MFGGALHRLFQAGYMHQRCCIAQRLGQTRCVATEQNHGAAVTRDRGTQPGEVGALAVAAGDQHQLAVNIRAQSFDGCQCRTHVGGFGIIVITDGLMLADPLATVRQTGETSQRLEHRLEWQTYGMPESEGRQRIRLVVRATDLQLANRHQRFELKRQVLLAALLEQPEALEVRLAKTEGPGRNILTHQRPAEAVVAIDHHLACTTEDAVLGLVISRQPAVTVHVVFADIQTSGHFGIELLGGLQLEAGQLQYVQLDIVGQQI